MRETMIKCPVDEIGRYSVTPSTTPSVIASAILSSATGAVAPVVSGAGAMTVVAVAASIDAAAIKGRSMKTSWRTWRWFQLQHGGANLFAASQRAASLVPRMSTLADLTAQLRAAQSLSPVHVKAAAAALAATEESDETKAAF